MSESGADIALAARYRDILMRIRVAAAGRAVTLIAVSKMVPVEGIEALYHLGHRDFGENYVQELVSKAAAFEAQGLRDVRWHFIGHLQTNKVKQLVPVVHAVHSVDSVKLGQELAKRWSAAGRSGRLPIFIETNIDEEPGKSGVAPVDVSALATALAPLQALELRGLMCVPRPRESGESAELRARFGQLRELGRASPTSGDLSIGMSSDFELALAEGATHVRVGTALFGARPAGAKG